MHLKPVPPRHKHASRVPPPGPDPSRCSASAEPSTRRPARWPSSSSVGTSLTQQIFARGARPSNPCTLASLRDEIRQRPCPYPGEGAPSATRAASGCVWQPRRRPRLCSGLIELCNLLASLPTPRLVLVSWTNASIAGYQGLGLEEGAGWCSRPRWCGASAPLPPAPQIQQSPPPALVSYHTLVVGAQRGQ